MSKQRKADAPGYSFIQCGPAEVEPSGRGFDRAV